MTDGKPKTWYAYCVIGPDADDLGAHLGAAERDRALAADLRAYAGTPTGRVRPAAVTVGTVVAGTFEEALDAIRLGDWETRAGA